MHFRIIVTIIPRRFLTTKNVFGWNIAKDHVDCSLRSVAFILRWCNWFPYQYWIIFNLSMMPVSYIHWGHYNSTLWPWQKTFYDDQHHESPLSGESLTFVTAWTVFSGSPDTKLPLHCQTWGFPDSSSMTFVIILIHILFSGNPHTKVLWRIERSSLHIREVVHYFWYFSEGFVHNWISRANGQLLTIARLKASESFWSEGLLGNIRKHFLSILWGITFLLTHWAAHGNSILHGVLWDLP